MCVFRVHEQVARRGERLFARILAIPLGSGSGLGTRESVPLVGTGCLDGLLPSSVVSAVPKFFFLKAPLVSHGQQYAQEDEGHPRLVVEL